MSEPRTCPLLREACTRERCAWWVNATAHTEIAGNLAVIDLPPACAVVLAGVWVQSQTATAEVREKFAE